MLSQRCEEGAHTHLSWFSGTDLFVTSLLQNKTIPNPADPFPGRLHRLNALLQLGLRADWRQLQPRDGGGEGDVRLKPTGETSSESE